MRRSITRVARVVVLGMLASFALQGVAHSVIPVETLPGHADHEVEDTAGPFASTLTHRYNADKKKFVGSLKSAFVDSKEILEDPADESLVCVVDRVVKVFKKVKSGPDRLIGSSKVNSSGRWAIPAVVTRGKYYATVPGTKMLIREYYGGIDYYAACRSATTSPSGL
jgi:hypothetical protein